MATRIVSFPRLKTDYDIPYSRVHVTRMSKQGTFPKPRQLSPGRVGWVAEELEEWLRTRPLAVNMAADGEAVSEPEPEPMPPAPPGRERRRRRLRAEGSTDDPGAGR